MPRPDRWRRYRRSRSLRLSVRTPPFHGGESGSIPLGSATSGIETQQNRRFLYFRDFFTPVHAKTSYTDRTVMSDLGHGNGQYLTAREAFGTTCGDCLPSSRTSTSAGRSRSRLPRINDSVIENA